MIKALKGKYLFLIGFVYHFIFTIIGYDYYIKFGGDAGLYWFESNNVVGKKWLDFFNYGTDVVLFINYPLVKLFNLPIEFGFLLYSFLGFLGICQFYRLLKLWVGDKAVVCGVNIVPFVLLMPNLHYWTSILGKEALIFLFISTFMLEFCKQQYFSITALVALTFLLLSRPHLALILVFSFGVILLIYKNWNWKLKALIAFGGTIFLFGSFMMFLKLSNINKFDWVKIRRFNDYSLLSTERSASYIPMVKYTYIEKVFAFYFRPLFFDIHNFYGFIISIEDLFLLLLHIIVIVYFIKYFKFLKTDLLCKSLLLYYFVAAVLFVQRYSDLGLLIRTKVLIQPFVILALLWIIKEVNMNISKKANR